ncbi:site-specific DNA methylase [Opitutaceae bacterium TAV1]|nr:site-specific DNA methylase [Opitutaceae bacterium TAV1]
MHYYNEFDPKAAAWLRELIRQGHIPAGDVDERSITDVSPYDLTNYTQCHFFAGIGGWSLALRLAGWPATRPVWTGSCPCQPWSIGNVWQGGGKGFDDARHLWPDWYRLIRQCRPSVILGEQVVNAVGKGWWDSTAGDLEISGYAVGAAVLPACAFGAQHARKRLFWLADAGGEGWQRHQPVKCLPVTTSETFTVDGDALARARHALDGDSSNLLPCDGLSLQLARDEIKGYGNAIVPQVAAEFIRAFLESGNT